MKLVGVQELLRMRSALFAKTLQQLNGFEITFTNNVCIFVIRVFCARNVSFSNNRPRWKKRRALCPWGQMLLIWQQKTMPTALGEVTQVYEVSSLAVCSSNPSPCLICKNCSCRCTAIIFIPLTLGGGDFRIPVHKELRKGHIVGKRNWKLDLHCSLHKIEKILIVLKNAPPPLITKQYRCFQSGQGT